MFHACLTSKLILTTIYVRCKISSNCKDVAATLDFINFMYGQLVK